MKPKDHLPFFGIGPLYVALIVALTAVEMILSAKGCLDSGIVPVLKTKLRVHNGLSQKQKRKFITEFLKA